MTRFVLLAALTFFTTSAAGEELVLKDGTKIVGKMTAINGDKIEVETSYGKMQVNRADIVSINFPENAPASAAKPAEAPKAELPKIDESLDRTRYVNKTQGFSLTLPKDWMINSSLRVSPEVVTALSSKDELRYLMVTQEEYSGSLESYGGLVEIQGKTNLQDYQRVSQKNVTIDGKPSMLICYRGVSAAANNLPIEFLVAMIPDGKGYSRITTWCVEPLFKETQTMFEQIINSYHQTTTAKQ